MSFRSWWGLFLFCFGQCLSVYLKEKEDDLRNFGTCIGVFNFYFYFFRNIREVYTPATPVGEKVVGTCKKNHC